MHIYLRTLCNGRTLHWLQEPFWERYFGTSCQLSAVPLGTRLLYFDTRTRTELGVPTLLRYAATTRSNYQGMRTKQTDARAQRRHISTRNPSAPARAPIYARASLFSLSIISPFSHLQQTFARSLSLNYSTQQFPPPIRSWKHSTIGTTPSMPSIDDVDIIIVTMAVENK